MLLCAQRLTASRLGASPYGCAQRLTASRLGALPRKFRGEEQRRGAQRLTASRLGASGDVIVYGDASGKCSTPYGITARCIAVSDPIEELVHVLNALRHHGSVHVTAAGRDRELGLVLNALRHHGSVHSRPQPSSITGSSRAQRLTASRLGAFRQSPARRGTHVRLVLNALRHHGSVHCSYPARA